MTRIPVHTVETAPEFSRDELKSLEARFGKVMNLHGAMAHAPVALQSYVALQQVIDDYGTFDAATREALALVVAEVDGCSYCQAAHTGAAKAAGFTAQQTMAIRNGSFADDHPLAALLALVREATGNVGSVADGTWHAAAEAGWTDPELTEVSAHIAVNLFTNYLNHLVQTDLDLPAAPAL